MHERLDSDQADQLSGSNLERWQSPGSQRVDRAASSRLIGTFRGFMDRYGEAGSPPGRPGPFSMASAGTVPALLADFGRTTDVARIDPLLPESIR
jgi:hypothetical protein